MFGRLFLDHPHAMGETYWGHQKVALSYALPLLAAGLACLIHALAPGLFQRAASDAIRDLHGRMSAGRGRAPSGAAAGGR